MDKTAEDILGSVYIRESVPYSDKNLENLFEANAGRTVSHDDDRYNFPGFKETTNFKQSYYNNSKTEDKPKSKAKKFISKFFSQMSRWGLNYEGDIIKSMRALPADKGLLDSYGKLINASLYGALSSSWKVKDNKDKDFNEKNYCQRRDTLRTLAAAPELEDILDRMANECIVYDSNNIYFAEPFIDPIELKKFDNQKQKQITDSVNKTFNKLYKQLQWNRKATDDFKRWLIEGELAFEITYDSLDKPTQILGLVPLDPATLTKKFKDGKFYWVQFSGVIGKERALLDAQVVFIQFQETNSLQRTSYLERLIRPFNIYRILEQAQIIWTVTNAQYKMLYKIPTKGMNKALASQTLASAMNAFKEDISFNLDSGELKFKGKPNMPFMKEIWTAESDAGSPDISVLGGEGPELADSEQLNYFLKKLYKVSKIPLTRFDDESGETWFGTDASSVARQEIDFSRYVNSLRAIFSDILLKPITMQLCLDVPELLDNKEFLNSIILRFKSYNVFENLMEQELMKASVDFIQSMKDSLVNTDANGNEVKYFSDEMLVRKYLRWSDDDIKLNAKLRKQEMEELNKQSEEAAEAIEGGADEDEY